METPLSDISDRAFPHLEIVIGPPGRTALYTWTEKQYRQVNSPVITEKYLKKPNHLLIFLLPNVKITCFLYIIK